MRTARDIEQFEAHRPAAGILRVVTLGAAGAGRSTLVERLGSASPTREGPPAGAPAESSISPGPPGNRAGVPDAAREAAGGDTGLAPDLTYRLVTINRRACLIADLPGDEPDTRRLVSGASAADVALVVVDATQGLDTDARRHTCIASLLGIRRVALVVNKLDLAGYAADVFDRLRGEYTAFGREIGLTEIACIPISALHGDNVAARSANTPWHDGPTVLGFLETVPADAARRGPFRMFVRDASRTNDGPATVSGPVVGGTVRTGDRVRVLPSARESVVSRLTAPDGALLEAAAAGSTITMALADALDVSPGDLVAAAGAPPELGDQFEASVIWMSDAPMLPGRTYAMTIGAATAGATITKPKHKVHVHTLERLAARTLEAGDIGVCNLHVDRMIPFDPHGENRHTGGFVLIDPLTQETIGAGVLHFALRRSQNIHWQAIEVDKGAHAALNGHRPCIVWFTGLSGAGKSTIANIVERKLHAMGRHTFLLDGDNVRHGLNKDLGFTEADRVENIRRVAEVARLMVDAGLIVLVSFISPFRAERRLARSLVADDEFCEVFVDAPLAVAEARDRKGLYKKARRGELKNFTGIDSPYEPPENPELRLDTSAMAAEAAADLVVAYLDRMIRASGRD